jgi:hypothetical protein
MSCPNLDASIFAMDREERFLLLFVSLSLGYEMHPKLASQAHAFLIGFWVRLLSYLRGSSIVPAPDFIAYRILGRLSPLAKVAR